MILQPSKNVKKKKGYQTYFTTKSHLHKCSSHTVHNTTSITRDQADSFVKVRRKGEENGIVELSPPTGRCTDRRVESGRRDGGNEVGKIRECVAQPQQLEREREEDRVELP